MIIVKIPLIEMGFKSIVNPKAVIFDLDGTLCDYEIGIQEALEEAFERASCSHLFQEHREIFTEENYRKLLKEVDKEISEGATLEYRGPEVLRRLLRMAGSEDNTLALEIGKIFIERLTESVILKEDAERVVHSLREFKLGLITNGPSNIQWRKINKLGIEEWFDGVIVSGDLGIKKPESDIFLKMLDILGSKEVQPQEVQPQPEETIYVGDSQYYDVQGAKRAGLLAVWINPDGEGLERGLPQPDFEIRTLGELLDILKGRGDVIM